LQNLNPMVLKINRHFRLILLAAGALSFGTAQSQTLATDSLSLNSIISEVVQNHPEAKKAQEDLNVADAKVGLAESYYKPNVDFTSSYSHVGPISSVSIPNMGTFSFNPHDNYSAAFNVNQTVFDFGKKEKTISLEKQGKELSRESVEQVKQKLSQAVIANYYTLVYLQEALKIKDEQLKTLNEHLAYIKKKQQTGSATQYEILTTQVRISAIENQKTDIETSREVQVAQLNSLLGRPESTDQLVKKDLQVSLSTDSPDSLMNHALRNRDEMKLAREKSQLVQMRYNFTQMQNKPVVNAYLSGGIKDGYSPYLYDPKLNFAVGFGIKVPISDGKRMKYNLDQTRSAIRANDQDTEIARRGIVNEVVETEANVKASGKKVDQSELQLKQAVEAYNLAKTKFDAGVITNLELIDGATTVSESRLQLLKAKIDYTVSLYKLKSATGERLY
jgi:outer membrane protein